MLDCEKAVLPEVLSAEGYSTRLYSFNRQLTTWDGWDRGFSQIDVGEEVADPPDHLYNWGKLARDSGQEGVRTYLRGICNCVLSDSETGPSLRWLARRYWKESDMLEKIIERIRLDEYSEDEFLLLNLMDVHQPYDPPPEYSTLEEAVEIHNIDSFLETEFDAERRIQAYDDCVAYLSDRYRYIFQELQNRFDLVITLSDHGEALGEGGQWAHDYGLRPELTHIGLSVWAEDIKPETVDVPASIIDVHQTVADFAGVTVESRGQNLLTDLSEIPRLTQHHGIFPPQRDRFVDAGLEDVFDSFDTRLDGVITEYGYGYETLDGVVSAHKEEHHSTLETVREDVPELDDYTQIEDSEGISFWKDHSSDKRDRLKALGYL
jgi:arylsulfatase